MVLITEENIKKVYLRFTTGKYDGTNKRSIPLTLMKQILLNERGYTEEILSKMMEDSDKTYMKSYATELLQELVFETVAKNEKAVTNTTDGDDDNDSIISNNNNNNNNNNILGNKEEYTNGGGATLKGNHKRKNDVHWFLTKDGLDSIANYKYVGGEYTTLDNLMNIFWTWVVEFVPLWVAPNLITFIGLVLMWSTCGLLFIYTPHLDEELPTWVMCYILWTLFMYQTLDAIDGKQARRTGASSPLGQLFDHGCDSINTTCSMMVVHAMMKLGHSWLTMYSLFQIQYQFYIGQWEEYHTGVFLTNDGNIGITEAQVGQMLSLLVTIIFGQGIWDIPLFTVTPVFQTYTGIIRFFGLENSTFFSDNTNIIIDTKAIFYIFSGYVMFVSMLKQFYRVFTAGAIDPSEAGNKTLSNWDCIAHLIPPTFILFFGAVWTHGPGATAFENHTFMMVLCLGTSLSLCSTRMIVQHMAKEPLGKRYLTICPVLPIIICVINEYWNEISNWSNNVLPKDLIIFPIDQETMINRFALYLIFFYFIYVYGVIKDICGRLDIYCLTIKKKKD